MSGFEDYHNKVQSPAKVYHKWSAGSKVEVELPDGSKANKLRGELKHWDAEAKENIVSELPFKFAVLEQTKRISGFNPGNGTPTRYYSNEAVEYDETLKVFAKSGDAPAEVVVEGVYSDIKPKLPAGARLATVLYGYNPATEQIEVITLQGAALSAFIEFSKANKIYTGFIEITEGEKTTKGATEFVPPMFKMGDAYNDKDMETLHAKSAEIKAYLDQIKANNTKQNTLESLVRDVNLVQEAVDEEPSDDGEIDLSVVPF